MLCIFCCTFVRNTIEDTEGCDIGDIQDSVGGAVADELVTILIVIVVVVVVDGDGDGD